MSVSKFLRVGKLVSFVAAATVVGALLSSASSSAADTANTIKVSPVRTDITADPGTSKTVKITVTNPTKAKVAIRPIQNDFVADDEDGSPALILDENEYAPSHSLKRFLKPLKSFDLDAGASKTVEAVISVPQDAEAGGYFGAIRFAPTDPDTGGQVNMSASVASLILLRVNGDAPEKLDLTDFIVKQDGKPGSFFTNSDKMSLTVRFKNDSSVQLAPFGKISVTSGDKVVYQADFNNKEQQDMVLPGSARKWVVPLDKIEGFGKYKVSATLSYGIKGQTIEQVTEFWVVPLPMIIGAGVALLLVIGAIVGLVLRKRYGKKSMSMGLGLKHR